MYYLVKEVADMAGISVRMLHHYDKIGLLKPESVSPAGYRLYTDQELEKLQQVLFYKELDFSLNEIKTMLNSPDFDRIQALKSHKKLLLEKKKRLDKIIQSVEVTINSIEGGREMDKKEMFEPFDMTEIEKHKEKYADEARQKYGHSDAYKESQRRTSKYTKDDWAVIQKEGGEIYRKIADRMAYGPADPQVQQFVDEWRQYISKYFYECTPEIFRGLGDLYVSDHRFTANIDKVQEGLAAFLKEAMINYCDNLDK